MKEEGKRRERKGRKKSEGLVQNPGATGCTISVVICTVNVFKNDCLIFKYIFLYTP